MTSGSTTAAAAELRFHVLGPLEVTRGGVRLQLGPPKQRAVLAALVLGAGKVVSADRLVASVWGDDAPARALANVQVYVSKLRSLLGGDDVRGIVRRAPGYVLTGAWVDVAEFRKLAALADAAVRTQSWAAVVDAAERALALWRGPLLDDLADEPWVAAESVHMEELSAQCLEAWVTGLLGLGRVGEAVTRCQTLVESAPLREHSWWLRMIALHRAGRSPEALEAFQRFAGELDDQLGLEPGPELRALQTAVLRHDASIAFWPGHSGDLPGEPDPPAPADLSVALVSPASPAPPTSDRTVPHFRRTARVIGREPELTTLQQALDDVLAGGYRWAVLTGRAGIGKTRLASEIAERARARGAQVGWTTCPDDDAVPAWWPLRTLVTDLGADPEDILRTPAGSDADTVRFVLYERLSRFLEELAAVQPLLLVIDDAQWLDPTSLRWLGYLAHTRRLARVGVVLTVRDRELRPEFGRALAAIGREESAIQLPIDQLTGEHATELLRSVADDPISATEAFTLFRRIGGNPLLLGEFARLPAGERRDGQMPLAARSLLERRLRRLAPDVMTVLSAAAIIGDVFELQLLAEVTGRSLMDLVDVLDAAADEAIITPAATGVGYQFAHGLLRDAVVGQLTALRRQALHARTAEALVGGVDHPYRLIQRAHHLSAALQVVGPAAVVEAAAQAARAAQQVWDWEAAGQMWAAALEAQQLRIENPPSERDELLIARFICIVRSGRPLDAVDAVAAALQDSAIHTQAPSVGRLAAMLLRTAGTWGIGAERPALLARLQDLLSLVGSDPAAHARVLAALAVGNHANVDPGTSDRQSRAAMEIAEDLDDPDVLADALVGRTLVLIGDPTRAAESLLLLQRLGTLSHRLQDNDELLRHNRSTMVQFALGDVAAATEHLQATIRGADRFRYPFIRVQMRWFEVLLAQWHGDFELADELADLAYERHRYTESWGAEQNRQVCRVALRWERGQLAQQPLPDGLDEPLIWGALRAAETRDHRAGRELLARRLIDPHALDRIAQPHRILMSHAAADLGDAATAENLLGSFKGADHLLAGYGYASSFGPVALATARLHQLLGHRAAARADLDIAEDLSRRGAGTPSLLRIALARLQLEPVSDGRRAALRVLADEALRAGMAALAGTAARAAG